MPVVRTALMVLRKGRAVKDSSCSIHSENCDSREGVLTQYFDCFLEIAIELVQNLPLKHCALAGHMFKNKGLMIIYYRISTE